MENIVLRQHSPIVVSKITEKSRENEIPLDKPKSSGIGWIVAGIIVLAVLLFVIISSLNKDREV